MCIYIYILYMYVYIYIVKTIYHIAPANLFPTFEDSTLLANTLRIGQGGLENVGGCRGLSGRRRWPSNDEGGISYCFFCVWAGCNIDSYLLPLPETNSKFAPDNGCLEYDPFLLGQKAYLLGGNWRFLVKN